jgi:hypothetical protein
MPSSPGASADHDELLHRLQRASFDYFVHETNAANGMVLDKTAEGWPASIAAIGMALTAYPVGVERGFIGREQASAVVLATLRFLAASEQGEAPGATGHRGFYYHFLEMKTGRRARRCELSSIDTALLVAGALAAAVYFDAGTPAEVELRGLAQELYERVDWAWMLNGGSTLSHGWKPKSGFLRYRWQGYDEALVLYLLALGSPTHPIGAECYDAWCSTFRWKNLYGVEFLYAGPLFIHQLSHVWCDLRGVRDGVMRERNSDYFENSRRATRVQQLHAIRNTRGFGHAGALCWGATASDGPGPRRRSVDGAERFFFDYVARGVPFGPDDGTIAPWAVAASLPFAPEIVMPTIAHLSALPAFAASRYGPRSFNPGFRTEGGAGPGWVSPHHFGIDAGPTVLMIENHRSGLVWSLMRRCGPLVAGLVRAGFTGGWLDASCPVRDVSRSRPV